METIIVNSDGTHTNERTGNTIPPQPSEHHEYDAVADMWIDARTLDGVKVRTWERIKAARSLAETADFMCGGVLYQADKDRIVGAAQLALMAQAAGQPYSIDWTLSDNTHLTLDAAGMIGVGAALGAHVAEAFAIALHLRGQIAAATSFDALDAIVWPAQGDA
ncbi:DUF4376 domain-containing protein [Janthinobacterium kumbetense]|uniref:DUF4376 domain-containing protein n=1 Tax=Janthinobacterium kumbetense TaxID=2950280 RepID=A0ABT0WJP1_9BURK|nr:DUF4376 domain-containing protein [Janthinobacterium kumbetense]MCM2564217.1 DUF4376 domain-containing protein [Janthinobacterium kumbetense]